MQRYNIVRKENEMYIDEKMLIESKIPDEVDLSEWEVINEDTHYWREFIMRICKWLQHRRK